MEDWTAPPSYEPLFPPPPPPEQAAPGEPVPRPGRANKVYLLLLALLIATSLLSAFMPGLRWLFLLAGDPILLVATLLVARREKRALRPALRWNWSGWTQVGLGLVMGLGAYTAGVLVELVVTLIFGPVQNIDIRSFINDPLMLAAFLLAAVVMAPLCEELIFRGYFLGIYEHYMGRAAVLALVSLLFAVLHLQFFGIFSILPAAFLLTYMAMRSGSLAPGMAAHFAFNLAGSTLGLTAVKASALLAGVMSCGLILVAPLAGIFALAYFRRITPPRPAPARLLSGSAGLRLAWPLVIAGLVYIAFAGAEVVMNRFPQLLAGDMPGLRQPAYRLPASFNYQADTLIPFGPAASIQCSLADQGASLLLDCKRSQPGMLFNPASRLDFSVTLQAGTLDLESARYTFSGSPQAWSAEIQPQPDGSYIYVYKPAGGAEQDIRLPAGALVDGSWPWQLSGLDFTRLRGRGGKVQLVSIDARGLPSVQETAVQNLGLQQDDIPSGSYQTWNLTVGRDSAHYDLESPHLPVEFTWGGTTYQLKK
jgi:uncharacterized protein